MAPKVKKSVRLQALAAFVREPKKLEELWAEMGTTYGRSCKAVPSERTWYKFLYNNVFDEMDNQALLEELNAEVTVQQEESEAVRAKPAKVQKTSETPTACNSGGSDVPQPVVAHCLNSGGVHPADGVWDGVEAVKCAGRSSPRALCLRGLNVQWPFSQLLLLGRKTTEVRGYALGHRNIA